MRLLKPFLETEVITYFDDTQNICACVIQNPSTNHIQQDGNFRLVVLDKALGEPGEWGYDSTEYHVLKKLFEKTQHAANEMLKHIQPSSVKQ